MKFILASGSPRRKELLAQIGIEYEVVVSEADENTNETDPAKLVEELSSRKARAVLGGLADYSEPVCIIGADTVVALDGQILGKPGNAENSKKMLELLSGRSNQVFTGVTLVVVGEDGNKDNAKVITFHEKTDVYFAKMSEKEIDEYVATKDPFDKAGAYGIQGFCARYITGIDGDYSNVVGLPVGRLYQEMKKNNIM